MTYHLESPASLISILLSLNRKTVGVDFRTWIALPFTEPESLKTKLVVLSGLQPSEHTSAALDLSGAARWL